MRGRRCGTPCAPASSSAAWKAGRISCAKRLRAGVGRRRPPQREPPPHLHGGGLRPAGGTGSRKRRRRRDSPPKIGRRPTERASGGRNARLAGMAAAQPQMFQSAYLAEVIVNATNDFNQSAVGFQSAYLAEVIVNLMKDT